LLGATFYREGALMIYWVLNKIWNF